MMNLLMNEFRAEYKDDEELAAPVSYLTTFLPFDYINGTNVTIQNVSNTAIYKYQSLGLGDGTVVMLLGAPGTGKSTFAYQAAASIIAPFKQSMVLVFDAEQSCTLPRLTAMTGLGVGELRQKFAIYQSVTSEDFFDKISKHAEQKLALSIKYPEYFTYNTGIIDEFDKPMYKIIPTVVVLDSLPLLVAKDVEQSQDLGTNMSAATAAKLNGMIFKKLVPKLKKANIILLVVNHLNENINIGFIPKAAQVNYLKQSEHVPGGTTVLYLSNNVIRFTASTKLKSEEKFGIDGFMSKLSLVKSRTNRAGQEALLVYDQRYGFNRILSVFQMLKDNGAIKGSNWYTLDGYPECKFQQKKIMEKFESDEKFRYRMMGLAQEIGQQYLSASESAKKANNDDLDVIAASMDSADFHLGL